MPCCKKGNAQDNIESEQAQAQLALQQEPRKYMLHENALKKVEIFRKRELLIEKDKTRLTAEGHNNKMHLHTKQQCMEGSISKDPE